MNKNIEYDVPKKSGLSEKALEKLLLKWQKKLLPGWKVGLKIVNFKRKDLRQSGDFVCDPKKKTATVLMTAEPWRGDEEYTLVHELIHVLLFELDKFSERAVLLTKNKRKHDLYMQKLEKTVHSLTEIVLK